MVRTQVQIGLTSTQFSVHGSNFGGEEFAFETALHSDLETPFHLHCIDREPDRAINNLNGPSTGWQILDS